ncbi:MAG: transposase [Patescibacteria group bacterium]
MRFAPGEFYHIYNRGVEDRSIFQDRADYLRFIIGLWAFNSSNPVAIKDLNKNPEIGSRGRRLASVLSYALMKNHVHLLVRCLKEKDLSEYLQKIFIGYTMYFNLKHQRRGVLFQGKSKSKHVDNDIYLKHLINYIHLNPLDYSFPEWRNGKIKNIKKAEETLLDYSWSSLPGILGTKSDAIIDRPTIDALTPDKGELLESMWSWSGGIYTRNKEIFME